MILVVSIVINQLQSKKLQQQRLVLMKVYSLSYHHHQLIIINMTLFYLLYH